MSKLILKKKVKKKSESGSYLIRFNTVDKKDVREKLEKISHELNISATSIITQISENYIMGYKLK